jgi:hypothetical protein
MTTPIDRLLCWIRHDWQYPDFVPLIVSGRRIVRWCRRCDHTDYEEVQDE